MNFIRFGSILVLYGRSSPARAQLGSLLGLECGRRSALGLLGRPPTPPADPHPGDNIRALWSGQSAARYDWPTRLVCALWGQKRADLARKTRPIVPAENNELAANQVS